MNQSNGSLSSGVPPFVAIVIQDPDCCASGHHPTTVRLTISKPMKPKADGPIRVQHARGQARRLERRNSLRSANRAMDVP